MNIWTVTKSFIMFFVRPFLKLFGYMESEYPKGMYEKRRDAFEKEVKEKKHRKENPTYRNY